MKTSQQTKISPLILAITLFIGVACGRGPQGPAGKMGSPATSGAPKSEFGGSSGGGGFSSQNSQKLLEIASTKLSEMLVGATPIVFKELPKGWDQYKIATLIKSVRNASNVVEVRSDRELEFDYGTDAKGPYIRALKNFYTSYASTPVRSILERGEINGDESKDFVLVVKDVMIKLAKEAAHVVLNHPVVQGKKLSEAQIAKIEAEADAFSIAMMDALETDNLICLATKDQGYLNAVSNSLPAIPGGYAIKFTFSDGTEIQQNESQMDILRSKFFSLDDTREMKHAELIYDRSINPDINQSFVLAIQKTNQKMKLIRGIEADISAANGSLKNLLWYWHGQRTKRSTNSPMKWISEIDGSAYSSGSWRVSKEAIQQALKSGGYLSELAEDIGIKERHEGSASGVLSSDALTTYFNLALQHVDPRKIEFLIADHRYHDDMFLPLATKFLSPFTKSGLVGALKAIIDGEPNDVVGGENYDALESTHFYGNLKLDPISASKANGTITAKIQRKLVPSLKWTVKNVRAKLHCEDSGTWNSGKPGCKFAPSETPDVEDKANAFEIEYTYEEPVEVKIPLECQSASSIFHWQDYL